MQTALKNLENVKNGDLKKILNVCMDECCRLTNSKLSYFATMNDTEDVLTMQGWSNSAMANCAMITKPIVYLLEDTGMWGDAVRERKAIITNDYKNLVKPTKKGYPAGHVEVQKHMNAPIFDGSLVVGVIGVGNKAADYNDNDAKTIVAFMSEAWKIIKTKV